jgi:hypothetical protein
VVLCASQRRWLPIAIALIATGGQAVALAGLFLFGDQLRRRWSWFDRKCKNVRLFQRPDIGRYAAAVAASSGLLGLPPASVTATLSAGVIPRPLRLLPIMIVLRTVRFGVIATLAVSAGLRWPW